MLKFFERHPLIHHFVDYIFELIQVVVISLAIILPIRYFLIQPFYVKGASMEPSFIDHEYLIIDEISYRFRSPERGDIVVFRYPADPRQFFIKRIIGLPGEKVKIASGKITIYNDEYPDGWAPAEPYLERGTYTNGERTYELESNEYFVLGDNRNSSLDSRVFGPLAGKYLIGRAWLRGWPLDRLAVFEKPIY